jgi:hypothetical protein
VSFPPPPPLLLSPSLRPADDTNDLLLQRVRHQPTPKLSEPKMEVKVRPEDRRHVH